MSRGRLYQGSPRRHGCLHRAWRGQALPARRLPQVSSRRHGTLRCARRGQALPAPGLPQGSSDRRHATLHCAWGRQALPAGGLLQGSRSSSRQRVLQAMSPARAARRCVRGRAAIAWRGPGVPSHGWDRGDGARTPPTAACGECGATHRLATVVMCKMFIQQRARRVVTPKQTLPQAIRGFDGYKGRYE